MLLKFVYKIINIIQITSPFHGVVLYLLFYIRSEDGFKGPKHAAVKNSNGS